MPRTFLHAFVAVFLLWSACSGQDSPVGPQETANGTNTQTAPQDKGDGVQKPATFEWKVKPQSIIADVNETIVSNCIVTSSDDAQVPVYEWLNENGDIIPAVKGNVTSDSDLLADENGTLTIKSLNGDLTGKYTCRVGSELQETISIRFGRAVVLGDFPEKLETFVGCNITIQCRAKGDGIIEGSWLQGENVIMSGDRKFMSKDIVNDTSHFVLHILHSEASDGGVYSCEATNAYGPSAKESIEIILMEKPENSTCPDGTVVASAPQIDDPENNDANVAEQEKNLLLVYIVPAIVVGALILIAIIVAIVLIVQKRRQQQNAVFSGVKYRRTDGNEESIRA